VFFAGLTFSCVTGGKSGYEGPWYEDPALPGKIEKMYKSRNLFAMRQASIVEISAYAKQQNPKFLILPQNGTAMGFVKGDNHYYAGGVWDDDPVGYSDVKFNSIKLHKFDEFFLQAIDGWLNEEVMWENWNWTRVAEIRALKQHGIPILVSEPEVSESDQAEVKKMNEDDGFVYYIHQCADYDTLFPDIPIGGRENSRDINTFADAKNFLYFIGGDVEEDFDGLVNSNWDVLLVEPFADDDEDRLLAPDQVAALKTKANGGKRLVIAYLNIGAAENWRSYWKNNWRMPSEDGSIKGNPPWLLYLYEDYPDECFVAFWHQEWKDIIFSILDRIIEAGFDGVHLDNLDGGYEELQDGLDDKVWTWNQLK